MALRKQAWAALACLLVLAFAPMAVPGSAAWALLAPGKTDCGEGNAVSHVINAVQTAATPDAAILPAGNRSPAGREVSNTRTLVQQNQAQEANVASRDALQDAIAHAENGTVIHVTDNFEIGEYLGNIENQTITIDFAGHTLTFTGNNDDAAFASCQGSRIILTGGGELIANVYNALWAISGGEIVIDGITITTTGTGVYVNGDGSSVVLQDGTINAEVGIVANSGSNTIEIDGGSIVATDCGIDSQGGSVIITSGSITAPEAVITEAATTSVNITGGTITSTGDNKVAVDSEGSFTASGGTMTGTGGAVRVHSDNNIVNGGTFEGGTGNAIAVEDGSATTINGGIFSTNPTGLDGVTIADGNVISQVTSGTNAGKFRVTPLDTTADGWDLSAISGTVTANGDRFPAADATISYAWADGDDVITLNQTAEGSAEDGFYIAWTKNNDNGGISAQGLLFAASADDRPMDAGSYTGTIHGTGTYSGMSGTVQMTINAQGGDTPGGGDQPGGGNDYPYPINLIDCTLTAIDETPYTGDKICPKITLTDPNGRVLVERADYDLYYDNNLNPGYARIIAVGKGNYNYVKVKEFRILEPDATPSQPEMWGSCRWDISTDGTLTIHKGIGADTHGKCPWADRFKEIKKVVVEPGVIAPRNCSGLFQGLKITTQFDVSGLDVSGTAYFNEMFASCQWHTDLDLSSWHTTSALDMSEMFLSCKRMTSMNVSTFDTSKVERIDRMFASCEALEKADLRSFNTSKVEDMSSAFYSCTALKTIIVSNKWTTAGVGDYWAKYYDGGLFAGCTNLVGGAGTRFDANRSTLQMARIDSVGTPGYLTSVEQAKTAEGDAGSGSASGGQSGGSTNPGAGGKDAGGNANSGDHPAESGNGNDGSHPSGNSDANSGSGQTADSNVSGVGSKDMHRLYNPYSYEHFYTADTEECDGLVALGWVDEGVGWTAPTESDTPVYRLYNPYNGGDHHYTMDADERDTLIAVGWVDEDIGWYSAGNDGVPIFREYNPNELVRNHNYTKDMEEHAGLVDLGWYDELIAWYGV